MSPPTPLATPLRYDYNYYKLTIGIGQHTHRVEGYACKKQLSDLYRKNRSMHNYKLNHLLPSSTSEALVSNSLKAMQNQFLRLLFLRLKAFVNEFILMIFIDF